MVVDQIIAFRVGTFAQFGQVVFVLSICFYSINDQSHLKFTRLCLHDSTGRWQKQFPFSFQFESVIGYEMVLFQGHVTFGRLVFVHGIRCGAFNLNVNNDLVQLVH